MQGKFFKKATRSTVATVISLTLLLSGVCSNATSTLSKSDSKVAYYELTAKDLLHPSSEDQTFSNSLKITTSAKERLKLIVGEKKKSSRTKKIVWDSSFVENDIKNNYPELYSEIKGQVDLDKNSKVLLASNGDLNNIGTASISALTATEPIGESNYSFGVTAKNWYGGKVYSLYSNTKWTWQSAKVLGCWPSTSPNTFGNAGWYFAGLTKNSKVQTLPPYGPISWNYEGKFIYTSQKVTITFDVGYTHPKYYVNGTLKAESQLQITRYGIPYYGFTVKPNGGYSIEYAVSGY